MKNEYWISYKTKKSQELVIDIYDDKYMEQSREERFAELKRLLSNDIMDIKRVHILCQDNGCMLEIKKSWYGIERIVKIHHLLENAYASWVTPWEERNPVFDRGVLIPDNSYDDSHIPHYKIMAPKRSNASRNKHKEGETPLSTTPSVEYVNWCGRLSRAKSHRAIECAISTATSRTTGWTI